MADKSGRIIGASKIARDITEQKRREEQIALLAREADHRTNNLLAVAQATVHLTNAGTAAELKEAIQGRLQALANAQSMLAQSRWAGADLRELAIKELSPYSRNGQSAAQIEGPNLLLQPELAQAMAMALHELATNAVKYGALSTPTGRVKVRLVDGTWAKTAPALDRNRGAAGNTTHERRIWHAGDHAAHWSAQW